MTGALNRSRMYSRSRLKVASETSSNGQEIVSTDDFAVLEELIDFVEAF
jgi:hypothetical protein